MRQDLSDITIFINACHSNQANDPSPVPVEDVDDRRQYFCIKKNTGDIDKLKKGVRDFIYHENAFPTNRECDTKCEELCRQLADWDKDGSRRMKVSKATKKMVSMVQETRTCF